MKRLEYTHRERPICARGTKRAMQKFLGGDRRRFAHRRVTRVSSQTLESILVCVYIHCNYIRPMRI